MSYSPEQIQDLVNAAMKVVAKKETWVDVSFDKQNNCFGLITKQGMMPENDGLDVTLTLQIGKDRNARPSGLFDTDRIVVENLSVEGTVPWTKQVTGYKFDVDEPVLQGSAASIFKVVKMRAHAARNGWFELGEEMLFNFPAAPGGAEKTLLGLPYWFPIVTSSDGGFVGTNPDGHTAGCAGIDASTEANKGWRSYSFGYGAIDWEDFVEKVLKAMWYTSFKSPDPYAETKTGKKGMTMQTTYTVIEQSRRLLRRSNDDIGNFAEFKQAMFGSNILEANAFLTNETTNDPMYAANFEYFGFEFLKGRNQLWEKAQPVPGASRVREVPFVNWMRALCLNRRAGGFSCARR